LHAFELRNLAKVGIENKLHLYQNFLTGHLKQTNTLKMRRNQHEFKKRNMQWSRKYEQETVNEGFKRNKKR
jgi:hypothetical protein